MRKVGEQGQSIFRLQDFLLRDIRARQRAGRVGSSRQKERRLLNKSGLLTVALIGVHCKHPGADHSNARNGSVSKKPMGVLNCVATMPSTTSAPELLSVTMYRTCTVSACEHHSKFDLDSTTRAHVLVRIMPNMNALPISSRLHNEKTGIQCRSLIIMQSSLPRPSIQQMVVLTSLYSSFVTSM